MVWVGPVVRVRPAPRFRPCRRARTRVPQETGPKGGHVRRRHALAAAGAQDARDPPEVRHRKPHAHLRVPLLMPHDSRHAQQPTQPILPTSRVCHQVRGFHVVPLDVPHRPRMTGYPSASATTFRRNGAARRRSCSHAADSVAPETGPRGMLAIDTLLPVSRPGEAFTLRRAGSSWPYCWLMTPPTSMLATTHAVVAQCGA
jgi:hypothetical protein